MTMASDVDCACDEGINEIKWQNWQKGNGGLLLWGI